MESQIADFAPLPRQLVFWILAAAYVVLAALVWLVPERARPSAMLHLFEGIGRRLQALEVPERAQFNAATTLMSYVVGLAAQYAAGARLGLRETDRSAFLATVASQWTGRYDAADYPFVHQRAAQLAEHDDREQYLAGVDLILAGIETLR